MINLDDAIKRFEVSSEQLVKRRAIKAVTDTRVMLITRDLLKQIERKQHGWGVAGLSKWWPSLRTVKTFIKKGARQRRLEINATVMLAGQVRTFEFSGVDNE